MKEFKVKCKLYEFSLYYWVGDNKPYRVRATFKDPKTENKIELKEEFKSFDKAVEYIRKECL